MTVLSSRRKRSEVQENCDVLVVGAGPAGLFAAIGILLNDRSKQVVIVDAGAEVADRRRRQSSVDLVQGVGGAGLFSDGKLCLSLGVGGEIPGGASSERDRLLATVKTLLAVDPAAENGEDFGDLASRVAAASLAGLEFSYYPVQHLGTDHCADAIERIRSKVVDLGGTIRARHRLIDLRRRRNGFEATVRFGHGRIRRVKSRQVVLAMGKVGAHFESLICSELGVQSENIPMYVGLRLETSRATAAPMFRGVIDPKYKLYFPDGTKLKTHCGADGGEVLPLTYEEGVVAGGHSLHDSHTSRSSIAILWDGVRNADQRDRLTRAIMARSAEIGGGALIAQRMLDYRSRRRSLPDQVAECGPSASSWVAGSLRDILPREFFARFDAFMGAFDTVAPISSDPTTVLYGPSIEWWSGRICTNDLLETAMPGLYVAGEGGGWSQGIVHAAATGLIVAEGITGRPVGLSIPTQMHAGDRKSSVAA
jgi:uncharacterized protein